MKGRTRDNSDALDLNLRLRDIANRDEWLGWRRQVIGASEGGAILGIDPYRSPLAVYYDKRGYLPHETSDAAERGIDLEPGVIHAFRRRHPEYHVYAPDVFYDSPTHRVGCTPDAFFTWEENGKPKQGVLQCKLISRRSFELNWDNGNKAPLHYQLQTMIEAKLTGADRAILYAYVVDEFSGKPYEFEIPISSPMAIGGFSIFLKEAKIFWDNFDKGEPPPIDPNRDGKVLVKVFPKDDGSILNADDDLELSEWIERHEVLSATISEERNSSVALNEAIKERNGLRTLIKSRIGLAEAIKVGDKLVSWKTTSHDQKERFQNYRVLRIKSMKTEN